METRSDEAGVNDRQVPALHSCTDHRLPDHQVEAAVSDSPGLLGDFTEGLDRVGQVGLGNDGVPGVDEEDLRRAGQRRPSPPDNRLYRD